jgi:murein DD-endopeptidase MepM/ murein hydrolase activator NlpD
MILTQAQARSYAINAGFSGQALNIIVAIAQAESSLNTQAQHTNGDGSMDRGIVQINSRYHPEVSAACAFDPACAFQAAYKISSRGTNFSPWATFTSGAYLRFLSGGSGGTAPSSGGGKPWYSYPITHGYITSYQGPGTDTPHYALDIGAPMDTPVSFLQPGRIVKADYAPWGGEIFEQPSAGGPEEYFYHLDQIRASVGQQVSAGQVVGLSGGQTSGGAHPTAPQYSTGPHIHFGEFEKYVPTPDHGEIPYGPAPDALIAAANAGAIDTSGSGAATATLSDTGGTEQAPVPLSQQVNELLSEFPGFAGIAIALDDVERFPGVIWYNPGTSVQLVPGGSIGDIINSTASAIFDPQDYIGAAIRSVLDTIGSNMIPFFVRSLIVGIGLLLIVGLVWNALDSSGIGEALAGLAAKGAVAAA